MVQVNKTSSTKATSTTAKDQSAKVAIAQAEKKLSKPKAELSGDDMITLVKNATRDADGQAAGQEHKDLSKFVDANKSRLSPEALAAWKVYDDKATQVTAKGQTGISKADYGAMLDKMGKASAFASKNKADKFHKKFADASSGAAVQALDKCPKPVSGADMEKAIIKGTADADGQAAGREYKDLKGYVSQNWKNMSPDAKAKWRVYENKVQSCQARGMSGIPAGEYKQMVKDMAKAGYKDASAGRAIENQRAQGNPVDGDDMMKLIHSATRDADGQAAGKEHADLTKFVKENWKSMTPDAKEKWKIYDKTAKKCQAKGMDGIPSKAYDKMIDKMKTTGYQDQGAGKAIEELKTKPQPISTEDLQKAIVDGTKDWDGQAAGAEFNDLKNHVKENWNKLSPDAKSAWKVYENKVRSCRARGMKGIPGGEYKQMVQDMKTSAYQDKTAGAALETLNASPKPVSGAAMEQAIISGTKDFDNQAAGKEFSDISKWARQNWSSMTPEARSKFKAYAKHAMKSKAQGQTGMTPTQYSQMVRDMKSASYQDQGAGAAINQLDKAPKPISGDDLAKAVQNGTKDADGQAAGAEFRDLNNYVKSNWNKLSPDAKAKWMVYESKARQCQAKGQSGIPGNEYKQMIDTMNKTHAYKDAGAGRALNNLENAPKPISGDAMQKAIVNGTKDLDGQAAGKEFADIQKFAKENWSQMSPDARAKYKVYAECASKHQAAGSSGIPMSDYANMVKDMTAAKGYQDASAGKAIDTLQGKPKPISGAHMQQAIVNGTKDGDAQAAGKEYQDLKGFVSENWNQMSPDAKAAWRVYENKAQSCQAKGQSGIPSSEYKQMVSDMKASGYQDKSTGVAIEKLEAQPRPVSGAAMQQAIISGTRDGDGQAAGKEYADLKKYVKENWNEMSPQAKAKWRVYDKMASKHQAAGHSGIPGSDYQKMVKGMNRAGYHDKSAGKALEKLESGPKPITAAAMEKAIISGTKDADGKAASTEFADFKNFAKANWNQMTPEAKAKFRTYERYAESAQSRGHTGIPSNDYRNMVSEMKNTGYKDASSGMACEFLNSMPGPIDAQTFMAGMAFGTADLDGSAFGNEYEDMAQWVDQNSDRMTPGAKAAWQIYEKNAKGARDQGEMGCSMDQYDQMFGQMFMAGTSNDMNPAAKMAQFLRP